MSVKGAMNVRTASWFALPLLVASLACGSEAESAEDDIPPLRVPVPGEEVDAAEAAAEALAVEVVERVSEDPGTPSGEVAEPSQAAETARAAPDPAPPAPESRAAARDATGPDDARPPAEAPTRAEDAAGAAGEETAAEPAAAEPRVVVEEDLEPVPEPPLPPLALEAGSTFEALLDVELSTRSTRAGSRFRVRLTDDVLGADGAVLVPMDAHVVGRVLESTPSSGPDDLPVLALSLDTLVVDGRGVPMRGSVADVRMQTDTRDSDAETALKVGAGAAAGALLGKILGGDGRDALRGAVAGAVAGTAVAVATRDGHAVVPAGSRLVIRVDERLILPQR